MNIVSITVNAQGAGKTYELARPIALGRLKEAVEKLLDDESAAAVGVQIDDRDPGGGPCRPGQYKIEIIVDADVLPEAQPRDDDDD